MPPRPGTILLVRLDPDADAIATVQGAKPRTYRIRDPEGGEHDAYRIAVKRALGVGEYHGVQGTTWRDPPKLDDEHETVRRGGRRLLIYRDGKKVGSSRGARRRASTGSPTR